MSSINITHILKVDNLCKKYYKPETYNHCKRVAEFIIDSSHSNWCDQSVNYLYMLALCHDLFEDTDCSEDILKEHLPYNLYEDWDRTRFIADVNILTKQDDENYINYIERVNSCSREAYFVKLADIKDHLTQKETLTDELKKKYYEAIEYLL